jgi:hypothetical protein
MSFVSVDTVPLLSVENAVETERAYVTAVLRPATHLFLAEIFRLYNYMKLQ